MTIDRKLRLAILNRDNNRCRKCLRPIHLEIHHIDPKWKHIGDSDKIVSELDREDNLITLCVVCHEEWGSVETANELDFWEWLKWPPVSMLIEVIQTYDTKRYKHYLVEGLETKSLSKILIDLHMQLTNYMIQNESSDYK